MDIDLIYIESGSLYSASYTNQTNSSKIMISNLKTPLKVICDIL